MKKLFLVFMFSFYALASEPFIGIDELKEKIDNDNLVILDVGTKEDYLKEHIPNALHTDIKMFRAQHGKYQLLRTPLELQKVIRSYGIDENSEIVIYGHNKKKEILKSSYIALALINMGLENVKILNGAFLEWKYEDYEITSKVKTPSPSSYIVKPRKDIIVDREYVLSKIGKVPMLEARPSDFYYGTILSKGVRRAGHIPHAMSSNWKDKFLVDESLKDKDEIEEIFYNYDIKPDEEIIMYCTGGLEASMNWFLINRYLGFKKAKIYDASMREWGNRDDTPIQRFKWEVFKR